MTQENAQDYTIASETAERICIERGEVFGCNDIADNDRYIIFHGKQYSVKQAEAMAADLIAITKALKLPHAQL